MKICLKLTKTLSGKTLTTRTGQDQDLITKIPYIFQVFMIILKVLFLIWDFPSPVLMKKNSAVFYPNSTTTTAEKYGLNPNLDDENYDSQNFPPLDPNLINDHLQFNSIWIKKVNENIYSKFTTDLNKNNQNQKEFKNEKEVNLNVKTIILETYNFCRWEDFGCFQEYDDKK